MTRCPCYVCSESCEDSGSIYCETVKNGRTYWTCSVRGKSVKCHASIKQYMDMFTPSINGHCHPADPGAAKKIKIAAKVKRIAKERVFEPAANIVERVMKEMTSTEDFNLPRPDNLVRAANHHRRQRPDDPVNLDFELEREFIGEKFILDDIKLEGQRHLLLATRKQLDLLRQSRRWFVDGAFKLVKQPFYQLSTVHCFVKKGDDTKQVPLVYILMSRRTKRDYIEVFACLKRHLHQPLVEWFMMDFEAATWQAIRHVFPGTIIKGCVFHWTQRVYRKIQEVGLSTTYIKNGDKFHFLRQLMSLPFLPAEHITPAFRELRSMAVGVCSQVEQVVEYIDRTWIEGSVWRPENWSVFREHIRTNNDVEGWHRRINGKAGRANLPLYVLIPLLYGESETVDLQIKLISEHLLTRIQRKKYVNVHGKIMKAWDDYEEEEISTSQLLKRISNISGVGPTTTTTTSDDIYSE